MALALGLCSLFLVWTSAAGLGRTVSSSSPQLQTTRALVTAGGGPSDFKTLTLLGFLAGSNVNALVADLTGHFGAATVKQFITTFDLVVADILRNANRSGRRLTALPELDVMDGKTLSMTLYALGMEPSSAHYDVEYMLDRLLSHRQRVTIMMDVDTKISREAGASFELVLLHVMTALKAQYSP